MFGSDFTSAQSGFYADPSTWYSVLFQELANQWLCRIVLVIGRLIP